MIEDIVKLKKRGLTLQEIAEKMNMSLGKVQYRWNKYRQQQVTSKEVSATKEIPAQPKETKKEKWSMPFEYKEASACLMPHTPESLYVYWSFSESIKNMAEHHFRTKWEDLPGVLKVYDVTDIIFYGHNAHRTFEIDLPPMTNNWFLNSLEPDRTYIVDIGTRTFDGSFFTLLRSNPAETGSAETNSSYDEKIERWKHQDITQPEWLENFSTYSYYQKIR
ncbi:DUF4912 domain-containing protein [Fictibacillus phosphorivorans]|uniref:DUF4912 domain-containing protein n=1 Tax=Fictibacillus phosphorivorans TaxID=1221500 RepID=UPI00203EDAEC|nr:DUF4912 domain-containing protein [Fictibacillus phosphorivorans]MCM3716818.1 DUF4912 domain-containing protein [Fictibacillus phosphorivorans]MCM3774633.1 DUF4912 domain-containing protein [Fictibacillus phosphorivorans]